MTGHSFGLSTCLDRLDLRSSSAPARNPPGSPHDPANKCKRIAAECDLNESLLSIAVLKLGCSGKNSQSQLKETQAEAPPSSVFAPHVPGVPLPNVRS